MEFRQDVLDELRAIGRDLEACRNRIDEVIAMDDNIDRVTFVIESDGAGAVNAGITDAQGEWRLLSQRSLSEPVPF